MAQWNIAGKARNDFADTIESLTREQLQHATLCSEWTARDLLGHVTSFVETGAFGLLGLMVKSRFDSAKVSAAMVAKRADRSADDLVGSLRTHATKSAPLPTFPEAMTVSDVVIHTQDVRRPLGIDGAIDETAQRMVLDFLTTHKLATTLVDRRSLDGIRLEASDLDWSFGDGASIAGPAEALMMGLANRPISDELTGDGLSSWA